MFEYVSKNSIDPPYVLEKLFSNTTLYISLTVP